jgi:hypothetical protein
VEGKTPEKKEGVTAKDCSLVGQLMLDSQYNDAKLQFQRASLYAR